MKWDQHDSIKYSHINYNLTQNNPKLESLEIQDISESKSTVFETKNDFLKDKQ